MFIIQKIQIILTCLTINLTSQLIYTQNFKQIDSSTYGVSQKGNNSTRPGSYKQVLQASKTKLSSGDQLTINLHISGYGAIDYSTVKVYYNTSSNFIDNKKSYFIGGITYEDDKISFGSFKSTLDNSGLIMLYANVLDDSGKEKFTLFNDGPRVPYINLFKDVDYKFRENNLTVIGHEISLAGKPPNRFEIQLADDLNAGDYYFEIVLTYFNGLNWATEQDEIKLTIIPWYEKYSSLIQWLALIIAILTIITLIRPCYTEIHRLIKLWQAKNSTELNDYQPLTEKGQKHAEKKDIIKKPSKKAIKSSNLKKVKKNRKK
ncbi:hypothetical protein [Flagellimonas algicola]|uniref:Uncharacterized protein n=1 Tax=Flagellimonas algicola TaxID=2583815 RepID=A0ABY2WJT4_9FLAO|nr:hypothetical protein [Allomuricauda algicola]TMU54802.1 hypothetical protein FGG15_11415 [Allomuricauda algicola]